MEAAIKIAPPAEATRVVHEMTISMESFAAAGNWERTAEIAASLRQAVMQVPEALRRDTLLTAQRCLKQVHGMAHAAKSEVSDQLSALHRGRDATRAYTHGD
ncbi:MAG: hypothetical protein WBN23_01360 [Woeseia sp.]